MSEDIKQCPYCAETIKSKAIVCRFCRRNLTTAIPVKTAPITQEKKKGTSRKLILIITGGILLACCGILALTSIFSDSSSSGSSSSISSESDNDSYPSKPTTAPQPTVPPITATSQPIAPSIEEILETVASMTDAQRNKYNKTIKGNRVEHWQGEVSDVNEGEIFGGFTVYVNMVESNLSSEVHIDVSEDIALSLSKGEKIIFSGDIKSVSDILGTTVFIENATIESTE